MERGGAPRNRISEPTGRSHHDRGAASAVSLGADSGAIDLRVVCKSLGCRQHIVGARRKRELRLIGDC